MIIRIWHGWTDHARSLEYESLLRTEIFREIESRNIAGFQGIRLLRRETDSEVEFVTIMSFDSIESVKEFAGEEYQNSVVPQKAKQLLLRYDSQSRHYEVIADSAASG